MVAKRAGSLVLAYHLAACGCFSHAFLHNTFQKPLKNRSAWCLPWQKVGGDKHVLSSSHIEASTGKNAEYALIFDCDGVIIETEELHRQAYNAAFEEAGLAIDGAAVEWSVSYYDVLQNTVGGGKGKMNYHFRTTMEGKWPTTGNGEKDAPVTEEDRSALIDRLQDRKTAIYKEMISERAKPRPGIIELMDEAIDATDIAVGVCSASTKAAVTKVLDTVLGPERREKLDVCILGDDVVRLKPDPLIYITAAERLNIEPSKCLVVEDSIVGLKAAKAAGMKCLITYTSSTENEDFYGLGADAKIPDIGSRDVRLEDLFGPLRLHGAKAQILEGKRD